VTTNGHENGHEMPFDNELQMGMVVGEEKKDVGLSEPPSTEQLWTALHVSCASLIHHMEQVQSSIEAATSTPTNPYGLEYFDKRNKKRGTKI